MPLETDHYLRLKRNLLKCAGDFWTKYDCDELLDAKIGAVDSNYGKKGLAGDMILAKRYRFPQLCDIDFTRSIDYNGKHAIYHLPYDPDFL